MLCRLSPAANQAGMLGIVPRFDCDENIGVFPNVMARRVCQYNEEVTADVYSIPM